MISRLILKSQVLGTFSKVQLGKNQLGDEGAKLFADVLIQIQLLYLRVYDRI